MSMTLGEAAREPNQHMTTDVRRWWPAACVVTFLWIGGLLSGASASEAPREALATVKGVAMPFSVYGIVASLQQIPGVDHVSFDLTHGLATIRLKPGATVTDEQIRRAIIHASFTPGAIRWKSAPESRPNERGAAALRP